MNHTYPAGQHTSGTKAQSATLWIAGVFLLVGVLGFIPGFTTEYDQMGFVSTDSGAMLFSVFAVSVLHNIVHVLFGVAGLVLARTWSDARGYLVVGGVIYLLLWLYGLLIAQRGGASFVPLETADNWLHLVLGFGMFTLGVLFSGDPRRIIATSVDLRTTGSHSNIGRQL